MGDLADAGRPGAPAYVAVLAEGCSLDAGCRGQSYGAVSGTMQFLTAPDSGTAQLSLSNVRFLASDGGACRTLGQLNITTTWVP